MAKGFDSEVQCMSCGKRRQVNFGPCLRHGWPKCCGYTMTLIWGPYGGDEMIENGRVYGLDVEEERYAGIVDSEDG